MKKFFQIQIVRNLFGAVMGAGIAMALYSAYHIGAETVAYLISSPNISTQPTAQGEAVKFSNTDISEDSEKFKRAAERAHQIAQKLQLQQDSQHSSDTFIATYFVESSAASFASSAPGATHNLAAFPNATTPHAVRAEEAMLRGAASSQSHSSVAMQVIAKTIAPLAGAMYENPSSSPDNMRAVSAPKLPGSGPAEWIAMFIAFALAVPLNKKIQDRLLWSQSEEKVH